MSKEIQHRLFGIDHLSLRTISKGLLSNRISFVIAPSEERGQKLLCWRDVPVRALHTDSYLLSNECNRIAALCRFLEDRLIPPSIQNVDRLEYYLRHALGDFSPKYLFSYCLQQESSIRSTVTLLNRPHFTYVLDVVDWVRSEFDLEKADLAVNHPNTLFCTFIIGTQEDLIDAKDSVSINAMKLYPSSFESDAVDDLCKGVLSALEVIDEQRLPGVRVIEKTLLKVVNGVSSPEVCSAMDDPFVAVRSA